MLALSGLCLAGCSSTGLTEVAPVAPAHRTSPATVVLNPRTGRVLPTVVVIDPRTGRILEADGSGASRVVVLDPGTGRIERSAG